MSIDTSAHAVERKAAWLIAASRDFDMPAAARAVLEASAATLRALAAQRDAAQAALREREADVGRLRAEVAEARATFGRVAAYLDRAPIGRTSKIADEIRYGAKPIDAEPSALATPAPDAEQKA